MYTKVRVLERNTLCLSFFKNSLRFQPKIKRTGKQKKRNCPFTGQTGQKDAKKVFIPLYGFSAD